MNSLIKYQTLNHITNELTKPTPSLRLCLAIYMEMDRYSLFRYDHTRKTLVSSLEPLGFEGESRGFFQTGGIIIA